MNKFNLKFHRWLTNIWIYFASLAFVVLVLVLVCLCFKGSALFHTFYLFGVNPVDCKNSEHEISALIIAIIGIFIFNGLLITAFSSGIERYVERIRDGRKRFGLSNHYVMIGYNHYSVSIIEHILSKKTKMRLVILTSKNPEKVRAKLRAALPSSIDNRIILYAGDGNTGKHVSTLNLGKALGVYIMVEGNEWENQYTQSMLLLKEVCKYAGNRSVDAGNLLPVYLFINETIAFDLVQRLEFPPEYLGVISFKHDVLQNIDLHIFNFYENWARLLWSYSGRKTSGSYVYDSLDFEPIENTDKYVHLVIVGFNSMGRALALEALRICHYPNFKEDTQKNKSEITIIDPNSEALRKQWAAYYPNIDEIKDVKVEFVSSTLEDEMTREKLVEWNGDERQLLTIAICMADPDMSMSMAVSLPEEVFFRYNELKLKPLKDSQPDKKQIVVENPARTRILVRQSVKNSLSDLLSYNKSQYGHIKLFGTFLNGFDDELLNDDLAICVNGIYSDYFSILSDEKNGEKKLQQISYDSKFDEWKKNWQDCNNTPETHKLATRYQIDHYRTVLNILERAKSSDSTSQDILITEMADVEHRRWIAERILSGWRQVKEGEKRIDSLKIHTCILSHSSLPEDELIKDKNVIKFAPILVNYVKKRQMQEIND